MWGSGRREAGCGPDVGRAGVSHCLGKHGPWRVRRNAHSGHALLGGLPGGREGEGRPSVRLTRFVVLGFVGGLGWWTNFLFVDYLIPAGILGLTNRWRDGRGLGFAACGFIVGALPFLGYNLATGGGSFAAGKLASTMRMDFGLPDVWMVLDSARRLVVDQLPPMWGVPRSIFRQATIWTECLFRSGWRHF